MALLGEVSQSVGPEAETQDGPVPPRPPLVPGAEVGRYVVVELIGAGGHGARVFGPGPRAGPQGGAQAPAWRRHRSVPRGAPPAGGQGDGPARAPRGHHGARRRPPRRPALHRHGAGGRGDAARMAARAAAALAGDRRRVRAGGPRARACTRRGDRAPRLQAGQRAGLARRPGARHRLRSRRERCCRSRATERAAFDRRSARARRVRAAHADRHVDRHARVHGAGADGRGDGRRARGRVRLLRRALGGALRRAPVPRQHARRGHDGQGARQTGCAVVGSRRTACDAPRAARWAPPRTERALRVDGRDARRGPEGHARIAVAVGGCRGCRRARGRRRNGVRARQGTDASTARRAGRVCRQRWVLRVTWR